MRPVREIGDELYALPPAAFTAARDEWIAEARREGDKAVATELGAMKRPSQAAWLVNLLTLRRPETVTDLIDLGDTIRSAQGSVPPAQLRDLSAQRRKALDAALSESGKLARAEGQPAPTRAQLDEVEATLAAAMADDSAAELVRAGRVVKALRYTGFGDGFGLAAPSTAATATRSATATATSEKAGSPKSASARATSAKGKERDAQAEAAAKEAAAEAAARRAAAEERVAEAVRVLDVATADERTANAEVDRITAEIAAMREQLDDAQTAARQARQARIAAERDHESAQRRLARSS
jgi:hypothetical protein